MKRRFRWIWIGLLGAAVLAVGLYFVVRSIGSDRWPTDAIVVPRDVPSLGAALERASEGATIVLERSPDPYAGPITLDVRGLTLLGGASGVTIVAEGSEPALSITTDGVSVRNLTVSSGSIGIRLDGTECTLEGIEVVAASIGVQLAGARRCTLRKIDARGGRVGIELASSRGCRLEDLVVEGASEVGVKLVQSAENVVSDLSVRDVGTGISLTEASSGNVLRDCELVRASAAGIVIRGSGGNELTASRVVASNVGVLLEMVTENKVAGCVIEGSVLVGVSLRQAAQNRVTECRISGSGEDGIALSQSAENAISFNAISRSGGDGIGLDASDRNLIMENRLASNRNGIRALGSSENRFLRNLVEQSASIGVLVAGRRSLLLDNEVLGGSLGIVLDGGEENVLVRNVCERQSIGGIALLSDVETTTAEENAVLSGGFGLLVARGSRDAMLGNRLADNGIGLYLVGQGSGMRIEGNRLEANGIGLAYTEVDADLTERLLELGLEIEPPAAEGAPPVVANNTFVGSLEVDVANRTDGPLYAAGNWWGDRDDPTTEGEVLLEESAWKGTIVVGTKRSAACVILGRILQFALETAGYRVIDLVGLGDEESVAAALRERDVEAIWWRTRDGATDGPETGETEVVPSPVREGWAAVASPTLAARLAAPTISELSAIVHASGEMLRFAATEEFGREAFARFLETYGFDAATAGVTWTTTVGEAEAMVKFGAADVALVGNLEETLTLSGYPSLSDDLSVLASSPIDMVVVEELLERHPGIEAVLSALAARLTTEIVHDLSSRVRLLGETPEEAAREFSSATPLRE